MKSQKKFWTPSMQALAIAEIQIGIAMAKSAGVQVAGSVSGIKFTEAKK